MPICHEHGKAVGDKPMASAHQYPSKPWQLLLHHSKIFQIYLGSFVMPKFLFFFQPSL